MAIVVFDCEQNSPEWYQARLGIPTASEFKAVMATAKPDKDKARSPEAAKTRRTYMAKLAGERLTGETAETFSNAHTERGRIMEIEARNLYAFVHDADLQQVGFVRNGGTGCSPDSLIGTNGALEIKTKVAHLQIETLLADRLPPEHAAQVQGILWVTEREFCDFVSYWPRLPLFVKRVYRDEEQIKAIKAAVAQFNAELDALTDRIRHYGKKPAEVAA